MQNLTKLRHALAVSRTGSVTAAAQSLGSTQSTITKSLAAIEDELGFALFHRHARGMDVTERGEEFLTRASRIMADFDTLQADMNSDRQARNALLRLGITPASLQGLYNPAIRSLAASLPHVRVHVKATSPQHGLALLQRGDIELLIGPHGPMKGRGDLKVEQLADVSPRFFVRRGHPLEHCEHISATDLIAYPIAVPDLTSPHASDLHEAFARQGLSDAGRQVHVVDYFPLVTEMVAAGDVVGIVSENYAQGARFKERFKLLSIDLIAPYSVGLAWRKRWPPNPAMRAFLRIVRE